MSSRGIPSQDAPQEQGATSEEYRSSGTPVPARPGSSSDAPATERRGRAGYRQQELMTIPQGFEITHATGDSVAVNQEARLYANYVNLKPLGEAKKFHKYRIDFKPDIEALSLRKRVFREAAKSVFGEARDLQFDGYSEARSGVYTDEEESNVIVQDPRNEKDEIQVKVKRVGSVQWGSFEMLRLYNLQMKSFLKEMEFYCVGTTGAYVHNDTEQPVGNSGQLSIIRGFRTSANIHEGGNILMNLEPCHKIMQKQNVLQYMYDFKAEITRQDRGANLQDALRSAMVGKLVVTGYNKRVYKVEDIAFNLNPTSTFDKKGEEITFKQYYEKSHGLQIRDDKQPLIIAVDNNKRRELIQSAHGSQDPSIKLIPELCNIAGMTERQRTDNRIKLDMIRACQVAPNDRVKHMFDFINKLRANKAVKEKLERWGYEYHEIPVRVKGRILPVQRIGIGQNESKNSSEWPKVNFAGSFDDSVMREKINVAPDLKSIHVLISRASKSHEDVLFAKLKTGMNKVGFMCTNLIPVRIREGDAAHLFVTNLRQLPPDAKAVIIILPNQDKEKYDAIKKYCSIEKGLISQVVTTKLLTDERKSGGAITKIGIQIAAKLGGEPWRCHIPMANTMICGYDTYHDTLQRGKSFGAFVASTNHRYSRFWSKADKHDKLDELSTQLATNVGKAMEKFKELHQSKNYPTRIIIYRDGVSDGQIEHVFKIELESVKAKIRKLAPDTRLSFVIVNKRVGARFYMKQGDDFFVNPNPGCVVDKIVTRKERFDFYLVSQHTRQGTVTPTYYNIIHDNSALTAERHQLLAYNLCYLYYNWTGSVRVPAVCQYAHKLAYLCGEHLHASPNANLDDRLHFL